MKYIVLELDHGRSFVREVPILFPEYLVHATMAKSIGRAIMLEDKSVVSVRPVAAGFFSSLGLATVQCYGKSDTLDLASRGDEDVNLMKMFDYLHGLV